MGSDFGGLWVKMNNFEMNQNETSLHKRIMIYENIIVSYCCLYFEILDNLTVHILYHCSDFCNLEVFAHLKFSKFEAYSGKFPGEHLRRLMKSPYR